MWRFGLLGLVVLLGGCGVGDSIPPPENASRTTEEQAAAEEPVYKGKKLSQWTEELHSDDGHIRIRAAEALWKIEQHPDAIPTLVAGFKVQYPGYRHLELGVLSEIGEPAVPAVREALKDEDELVRALAASSLGAIGRPARPAVGDLVGRLDDESANVRKVAALALVCIRPGEEVLTATVRKALKDESIAVRTGAVAGLCQAGLAAEVAVPIFIGALNDDSEQVRRSAARGLGDIGPAAKDAVGALAGALEDCDERVRSNSAEALGRIGPEAKAAIPALEKAVDVHEFGHVRVEAALALWRIARHLSAVPVLIDNFENRDPTVRYSATEALAEIGPEAEAAVPVLIDALEDEHYNVRKCADGALAKIDPEAAKKARSAPPKVQPGQIADKMPKSVPACPEGTIGQCLNLVIMLASENQRDRRIAEDRLTRVDSRAKATAPILIRLLQHKDAEVRVIAAISLGRLSDDGEDMADALPTADTLAAVDALAAALKDRNWDVRRQAAFTLGQFGTQAKDAVKALTAALEDMYPQVRVEAAAALWAIDDSTSGVDVLVAVLEDRDPSIRARAADMLAYIGPDAKSAVPALTEALGDESRLVRVAAADALWCIDESAGGLEVLTSIARRGRADGRSRAIKVLGTMGPAAKDAVPALMHVLQHADVLLRMDAAYALWQIEKSKAGLPILSNLLTNSETHVESLAADVLGKMGPAAIPILAEGLEYEEHTVYALAEIGGAAVPTLRRSLDEFEDEFVRGRAVRALGAIGPDAKAAVPDLTALLKETTNPFVTVPAARALWKIEQSKDGLPALIAALEGPEAHDAAGVLWQIGPEAADAVPGLIDTLDDENSYTRKCAARALGKIGEPAVDALVEAMGSTDEDVRLGAASALGQIGIASERVVAALGKAVKDQAGPVRGAAIGSLGRLGPAAEAAVPVLTAVLNDPMGFRIDAAWALGQIGPAAKEAVASLRAAAKDENIYVRDYAAAALKKIEAAPPKPHSE